MIEALEEDSDDSDMLMTLPLKRQRHDIMAKTHSITEVFKLGSCSNKKSSLDSSLRSETTVKTRVIQTPEVIDVDSGTSSADAF